MPQRELTITVRGEKFVFTKGLLDSEPRNYFLDYFSNSFSKGEMQSQMDQPELVLYSDPKLFRLMEAHLCGYKVLPIPPCWLPDYMTPDNALENLKHDAENYRLRGLVELVNKEINNNAKQAKGKTFSLRRSVIGTRKDVKTARKWNLDTESSSIPKDAETACDLSEEGCRLYTDTFNRQRHLILEPYPAGIPAGYKLFGAWRNTLEDYEVWNTILEYVGD